MAKPRTYDSEDFSRPLRRVLVGLIVVLFLAIFVLWRIDSPRVERFRMALIDKVVPSFSWAMAPVTKVSAIIDDFQSYGRLYEQNQQLREELQQMKAWKEAALQLEQKNARLLDLNNVRLDPMLTHVTGVVLADSGSPFRQSVLLNVGTRDGIQDGWATMDGIGLVGRISGVGGRTSRVILLTDSSSSIPVIVQPSGQNAVVSGDNSMLPMLDFLEHPDQIQPGDRVISTGDGNVFPAGLLVGQVAMGVDKRLRVVLAADYERLEFLRVLRSYASTPITDTGALLVPLPPRALPAGVQGPLMPAAGLPPVSGPDGTNNGAEGAVSLTISDGTTGARSALTRELTFGVEWRLVAGVIFGVFFANRLLLGLAFVDQPSFGFSLLQIIWSVVAYPAVVAASRYGLDLYKPAMGQVDAFGRRM